MEFDYSWIYQRNNDNRVGMREEFAAGVNRFIEHSKTLDDWLIFGLIRCPCVRCDGICILKEDVVRNHLYSKGFHEDFLRLNTSHEEVGQNNFDVSESSRSVVYNNY